MMTGFGTGATRLGFVAVLACCCGAGRRAAAERQRRWFCSAVVFNVVGDYAWVGACCRAAKPNDNIACNVV
jgi:hypothetical protein